MSKSIRIRILALLTLFGCSFSHYGLALPDDKNQEIIINAFSSEVFLDQGIVIYYGQGDSLADFTQGSLKITGLKITIERVDGVIREIVVLGEPARFQQQPEVDQGVIHAKGQSIIFDNTAQLLSIDDDAEFIQDGSTLIGQHIDYDIENRKANATSGSEGPIRMIIPPSPDQ